MATGIVTLQGNVSGGADGTRSFGPFSVTTSASVTETLPVAVSGNTTVTIPSGTTTMVIIGPNYTGPGVPSPNPAYSGTLTLKGVNGDTGIPFSAKNFQVLEWDSVQAAPASIVINASVATTVTCWFQ